MSKKAKRHIQDIESLLSNLEKMKGILEKEPSPEHLCELEEAASKALEEMSPIHDYVTSLKEELFTFHRHGRKTTEHDLLYHPIENAHVFLELFKMGAEAFGRKSETVRRKGLTQDAAYFIVQFGKFWEENTKLIDYRIAGVRNLVRELTMPKPATHALGTPATMLRDFLHRNKNRSG